MGRNLVLIDTCVWISLYRNERSALGQTVLALTADNAAAFCGQTWVEYMGGFRNSLERKKYEKAFQAFPWIEMTQKTFEKAAQFLSDYPRLGSGDAIIAATAITQNVSLLTLDKDFSILHKEGLVLVHF